MEIFCGLLFLLFIFLIVAMCVFALLSQDDRQFDDDEDMTEYAEMTDLEGYKK